MQTIQARVNVRLLSKSDRLFTGTIDGRIIEILQNARRAGATEVRIYNKDGFTTIQDNGHGIKDFSRLLDLGGSGWDERLEVGEDPAGVGLFSLAPREVSITSGKKTVVIDKDGWTGKPVEVTENNESVNGTIVKFKDEKPWDLELVEKHAIFASIRVVVDGKYCHQMPFCSNEAAYHENPGCRIEVVKEVSKYHDLWDSIRYHGRVLVNFHGQVVSLDYWPGKNKYALTILVDIADQTNIRLMLPARTLLVENAALKKLKEVMELEYFKYFQKQKTHTLYYEEYLRAKAFGIEMPESESQYCVGLIWSEYSEPVDIYMPKDFKLQDCYLCYDEDLDEKDRTNAHLLAALGNFKDKPFIPVSIDKGYRGYSWAKLPTVTKVTVSKGKEKLRHSICCGELACFDKLSISVETSDGKTFRSDVVMAVITEKKSQWSQDTVCVTKEAKDQLSVENIWFHLGGYNEDGDSYDTQLACIEKDLQEFWNKLAGPYESLRETLHSLLSSCYGIYEKWQKITLFEDRSIEILFKDGRKELIRRPK